MLYTIRQDQLATSTCKFSDVAGFAWQLEAWGAVAQVKGGAQIRRGSRKLLFSVAAQEAAAAVVA